MHPTGGHFRSCANGVSEVDLHFPADLSGGVDFEAPGLFKALKVLLYLFNPQDEISYSAHMGGRHLRVWIKARETQAGWQGYSWLSSLVGT